MDKNWLIRTKSNHILGPVSKEKVLELYNNSSIKADDELCAGNGYWFFVRETELVEKYLLGEEVQGFNPISEAKDVIVSPDKHANTGERNDITVIGNINIPGQKNTSKEKIPDFPIEELVLQNNSGKKN